MRPTPLIALLFFLVSLNAFALPINTHNADVLSNQTVYESSCIVIVIQVWTNIQLLDKSYLDIKAGQDVMADLELIKLSNHNIKILVSELKSEISSRKLKSLLSSFSEICSIIDEDLKLLSLYDASDEEVANQAFIDNHLTLYERIFELYSI